MPRTSSQTVWLRLVYELDKFRDPAALPGWLATTTRHECLRAVQRLKAPVSASDVENLPDEQAGAVDRELLAAERYAALREAFSHLPPSSRAIDRLALRGPAGLLCGDQCQARHPRRQHRPVAAPGPGQATP